MSLLKIKTCIVKQSNKWWCRKSNKPSSKRGWMRKGRSKLNRGSKNGQRLNIRSRKSMNSSRKWKSINKFKRREESKKNNNSAYCFKNYRRKSWFSRSYARLSKTGRGDKKCWGIRVFKLRIWLPNILKWKEDFSNLSMNWNSKKRLLGKITRYKFSSITRPSNSMKKHFFKACNLENHPISMFYLKKRSKDKNSSRNLSQKTSRRRWKSSWRRKGDRSMLIKWKIIFLWW